MAHFAQPARVPRESRGLSDPFGRQPELGLLGRAEPMEAGGVCYDGPKTAQLRSDGQTQAMRV